MRKKTQIEFETEVKNLVGSEYVFLDQYISSHKKLNVKHNIPNCGHIYPVKPCNFLNNSRCPKCAGNLKKDTALFREEVKSLSNGEYLLKGEYINNLTKTDIFHSKCGKTYPVRPNDFITGYRCPYCAGNKKKTKNEFEKELNDLTNGEYLLVGKYINRKEFTDILHTKCGKTYPVRPNDFITGYRCPHCFRNTLKTTDTFKEEMFNLVKDDYILLSEYKGCKVKVKLKHSICGHIYEVRPNDFLRGKRCPRCNESKGEKEIEFYLKKYNINYQKQFKFTDCKYKKPLLFDFAILNKELPILLIEFDGKGHFEPIEAWGGLKTLKKIIIRDALKNKYCLKKNIPLLRIPYWDFRNIEHLLKTKLKI